MVGEIAIGIAAYYALGLTWIVCCRAAGVMVIEPAAGVSRARCEMLSALVWPYIVYHLARLVFASANRS